VANKVSAIGQISVKVFFENIGIGFKIIISFGIYCVVHYVISEVGII